MTDPDAERDILASNATNRVRVRRLGIDTQHEPVIFMRKDCPVCRAEGFAAHNRVLVANGRKSVIATLYQVTDDIVPPEYAGFSESAWHLLGVSETDTVTVSHPPTLSSLSRVRGKVYGEKLDLAGLGQIMTDVVAGRYSDIHLSSFITACSARPLERDEIVALTRVMTEAGDRLTWDTQPVVDKHCVGGLPGNRTTPIVVAIAAASGLTMPKTSSRAITSPAGTADVMETLAPVDLDIQSMRRVVEQEGGCVVWGGAVRLSPADDTLIRVERALELDSEGQLVASVLSKKLAAGSTHLVLDVPVGPTAKVRSDAAAASVTESLAHVAEAFGLQVRIIRSDGTQPVGRGIGPVLEARDVLAVLQGAPDAPADLRGRSLTLAGALLELSGRVPAGTGVSHAEQVLADGRAWERFQRICDAQGGMRELPPDVLTHPVVAVRDGRVASIDNRHIAKVAKLAGAPEAKIAGVEMHVHVGDRVVRGQPMYTVHAEAPGELAYGLDYVAATENIIVIEAEG